MPFVKGQSGNPGGKPKAVLPDGRSLTDLAKLHTDIAVQTLSDVMRDPNCPPPARVAAATALLDRGWGRPSQTMDTTITGEINIGRIVWQPPQ